MTRVSARLDRAAATAEGSVAHRVTNSGAGLSIPLVPGDMIEYLRQQFPIKMSREKTERDYDVILGHQDVISHLERLYAEQNQ